MDTINLTLKSDIKIDSMWLSPFEQPWPNITKNHYIIDSQSQISHIEPVCLAMIAVWADNIRKIGGRISISDKLKTPYAYSTGLLSAFISDKRPETSLPNHSPPIFIRHDEDRRDVFSVLNKEIITDNEKNKDAFNLILSESVNNVFEHSSSEIGCVICASRFQDTSKGRDNIILCVVDAGIGIANHMKIRHGMLTDQEALLRAIEPYISGTFSPGNISSGRASPNATNAGLGLFVIRELVKNTNGNFSIMSGNASVLIDRKNELTENPVNGYWHGTVICATYLVRDSSATATSVSKSIRIGISKNPKKEPFSWQPLPETGLRVIPTPTINGFLENKIEAHKLRNEYILPAINAGNPIEINLEKGNIITHSFAHALLYEAIKKSGHNAARFIHIRAKTNQIKDVVRMICISAYEDYLNQNKN